MKICMALLLSAVFTAVLTLGSTAQAKTISVNVYNSGTTLAPGDTAGVVSVGNWNNVQNTGGVNGATYLGLIDDSGATTTIDFSANGRAGNGDEKVVGSGSDVTMMTGAGWAGQRPTTGGDGEIVGQAMFTNVLAELGANYDVYVYLGIAYSGDFMGGFGTAILSSGEYTAGAGANQVDVPTGTVITSQQYATMRGTNAGLGTSATYDSGTGYIQTTGASVAQKGNYILFEDVNAADLVISLNPNSVGYQWNQNAFVGIQLVGEAAVPEPSSIALAGIGLVGLVGFGLRRRSRKNA